MEQGSFGGVESGPMSDGMADDAWQATGAK